MRLCFEKCVGMEPVRSLNIIKQPIVLFKVIVHLFLLCKGCETDLNNGDDTKYHLNIKEGKGYMGRKLHTGYPQIPAKCVPTKTHK